DHLRAVLHLRARDLDGAGEIAGEDQPGKRPGAGDVRALADVDEQRVVADRERLQAGETHHAGQWTPTLAAAPLRCPQRGSNARLGTALRRAWRRAESSNRALRFDRERARRQ